MIQTAKTARLLRDVHRDSILKGEGRETKGEKASFGNNLNWIRFVNCENANCVFRRFKANCLREDNNALRWRLAFVSHKLSRDIR